MALKRGGLGVRSILPPSHPPEESPLALKSKTCINDLHRARRPHTHRAKTRDITSERSQIRTQTEQSHYDQTVLSFHYDTHRHSCVTGYAHVLVEWQTSSIILTLYKDCNTTGSQLHTLYVGLNDCMSDWQTTSNYSVYLGTFTTRAQLYHSPAMTHHGPEWTAWLRCFCWSFTQNWWEVKQLMWQILWILW